MFTQLFAKYFLVFFTVIYLGEINTTNTLVIKNSTYVIEKYESTSKNYTIHKKFGTKNRQWSVEQSCQLISGNVVRLRYDLVHVRASKYALFVNRTSIEFYS